MVIKNKRILITAGPTWVSIDKARVISNIATGQTGVLLAQEFIRQGAKVTLLLGPREGYCLDRKIRLLRFSFFDELKEALVRELTAQRYDIVIHSAAVSDYAPEKKYKHKVSSGIKKWVLRLKPTVKIIDLIKKINPAVYLVAFKFNPGATKDALIREGALLMRQSNADLVVANTVGKKGYSAYIVGEDIYGPLKNKAATVKQLIKCLNLK